MMLHISAVVVILGCVLQAYLLYRNKRLLSTKVGTPSASHNGAITPCAHRFVPVDGLTVKGAEICIKCHRGRTAQ